MKENQKPNVVKNSMRTRKLRKRLINKFSNEFQKRNFTRINIITSKQKTEL